MDKNDIVRGKQEQMSIELKDERPEATGNEESGTKLLKDGVRKPLPGSDSCIQRWPAVALWCKCTARRPVRSVSG